MKINAENMQIEQPSNKGTNNDNANSDLININPTKTELVKKTTVVTKK